MQYQNIYTFCLASDANELLLFCYLEMIKSLVFQSSVLFLFRKTKRSERKLKKLLLVHEFIDSPDRRTKGQGK